MKKMTQKIDMGTMPHVMIDLETMSTASNAAIISIGAVKFDPRGPVGMAHGDNALFYMNVDLSSSISAGLHVDGATVSWWMQQTAAARKALRDNQTSLQRALNEFTIWFGPERLDTWGNGAAFDLVILRTAYRMHQDYPPWGYKNEMCYRTMCKQLPPVPFDAPRVKHNALSDACAQATHLQKLFQFIPQTRG